MVDWVLFLEKSTTKKSSLRIFDILDSANDGFLQTSNIRRRPFKVKEGKCNIFQT